MPKQPELLTKPQAAELLGRSGRAVARHAAAGRLTRYYRPKDGGGQKVYYSREQVEALRVDLETAHEQLTEPRQLAPRVSAAVAVLPELTRLIAAAIPAAPTTGPWLLTVSQAAKQAGVTQGDINRAIAAGTLPVVELQRTRKQSRSDDGRRIRPAALKAWVDAL